jgi:UDP-N-acetylglucosamine 2-epimerase (non-hydrolysing)
MAPGQDLAGLTARVVTGMRDVLRRFQPRAVLVHGDTTTCLASALAAFYERIPVGHVEAGLRTYNFEAPWPEEMNRRLVDPLCRWCFAPTRQAAENLRGERIPETAIFVTGNTAIDALNIAVERVRHSRPEIPGLEAGALDGKRLVLVTGHRRESFGEGLRNVCRALKTIAENNPDTLVVYPVHLNPQVVQPVRELLGNVERVRLLQPLDYLQFVWLMSQSAVILTDSGGIQEEAPSLGKPVLVMRETTERPEAVAVGAAKLVGTNVEKIVSETQLALRTGATFKPSDNPFGDGKAAERIAAVVSAFAT